VRLYAIKMSVSPLPSHPISLSAGLGTARSQFTGVDTRILLGCGQGLSKPKRRPSRRRPSSTTPHVSPLRLHLRSDPTPKLQFPRRRIPTIFDLSPTPVRSRVHVVSALRVSRTFRRLFENIEPLMRTPRCLLRPQSRRLYPRNRHSSIGLN